jgi:hypothetical protein
VIRRHGANAEREAAKRANLMLDRGDDEGQHLWARIRLGDWGPTGAATWSLKFACDGRKGVAAATGAWRITSSSGKIGGAPNHAHFGGSRIIGVLGKLEPLPVMDLTPIIHAPPPTEPPNARTSTLTDSALTKCTILPGVILNT